MVGFSSCKKYTGTMWMIADSTPGDAKFEYLCIDDSTAIESLYKFYRAVIVIFGPHYLRGSNQEDTTCIMAQMMLKDFLECLKASITCTGHRRIAYFLGKIYANKGHIGYCSVMLEAMDDYDLWIWHLFFGMPGSDNDINMLKRPLVFARLVEGHAPSCNYEINSHRYTKSYYILDDIPQGGQH
jgi:hypothetical protein